MTQGKKLPKERYYPRKDITQGKILSKERYYPRKDITHGKILPMERYYPRKIFSIFLVVTDLTAATDSAHNGILIPILFRSAADNHLLFSGPLIGHYRPQYQTCYWGEFSVKQGHSQDSGAATINKLTDQ